MLGDGQAGGSRAGRCAGGGSGTLPPPWEVGEALARRQANGLGLGLAFVP